MMGIIASPPYPPCTQVALLHTVFMRMNVAVFALIRRFSHHGQCFVFHDAEIGKNVSEFPALDSKHRRDRGDGCVVKTRRPALPQAPLCAQCLEYSDGRPGIWPNLQLFLGEVSQGQANGRQLLGGRAALIQRPSRRPQFPKRAGL